MLLNNAFLTDAHDALKQDGFDMEYDEVPGCYSFIPYILIHSIV